MDALQPGDQLEFRYGIAANHSDNPWVLGDRESYPRRSEPGAALQSPPRGSQPGCRVGDDDYFVPTQRTVKARQTMCLAPPARKGKEALVRANYSASFVALSKQIRSVLREPRAGDEDLARIPLPNPPSATVREFSAAEVLRSNRTI